MKVTVFGKSGLLERDPNEVELLNAAIADSITTNQEREPTAEERIEAQVMYTALMTDTLLMEE